MGIIKHATGSDDELTQTEYEAESQHVIEGVASLNVVRSATLVIAASDATSASKAEADYVCDGVADNVQIQAALTALTTRGGGLLYLSEGTFYLDTALNVVGGYITMRGANMKATILKASATITNMLTKTTGLPNLCLEDLKFDGDGKATNCINLTDAANGAYMIRLNKVGVLGSSGYGVILDGNEDSTLNQCAIEVISGKGLKWICTGGDVKIIHSYIAGDTDLAGQLVTIRDSTVHGITATTGGISNLRCDSVYFNSALASNIMIDAGTNGISQLDANSCWFAFAATGSLLSGKIVKKVNIVNAHVSQVVTATATLFPDTLTSWDAGSSVYARVDLVGGRVSGAGTINIIPGGWTPGIILDVKEWNLTTFGNYSLAEAAPGAALTTKAITLAYPYPDALYRVSVTPHATQTVWVTNILSTGFTINYSGAGGVETDWQATHIGV